MTEPLGYEPHLYCWNTERIVRQSESPSHPVKGLMSKHSLYSLVLTISGNLNALNLYNLLDLRHECLYWGIIFKYMGQRSIIFGSYRNFPYYGLPYKWYTFSRDLITHVNKTVAAKIKSIFKIKFPQEWW